MGAVNVSGYPSIGSGDIGYSGMFTAPSSSVASSSSAPMAPQPSAVPPNIVANQSQVAAVTAMIQAQPQTVVTTGPLGPQVAPAPGSIQNYQFLSGAPGAIGTVQTGPTSYTQVQNPNLVVTGQVTLADGTVVYQYGPGS